MERLFGKTDIQPAPIAQEYCEQRWIEPLSPRGSSSDGAAALTVTVQLSSSHPTGLGETRDGGAVLLFFILFILLETVSQGTPGLLPKKHLHFDPPYTPQRAMKATMLRPGVNRMCYQQFRKLNKTA